MLDLIKVIIEILGKFLNPSEILKLRRAQRLGRLGIELFELYVNINEILISAEFTIDRLKGYLKHVTEWEVDGHITYSMSKTWMLNRQKEIEQQLQRIKEVEHSLFFLGTQLQILNAEAYAKLMIFLDRKSSLLQEVTDVLSQKLLPLSPNDELEALLLSGFELKPEEDYPRDRWSLREKIRSKLHDWAIPFSGTPPWDANTYKKIEIYLDSGKPRQQLDEIRAALEQLYNTLKENFSIEDILPKVSGRRPDPRNH